MKMFSWNVNGLNSCIEKGFLSFFNSVDADFFCLQETKCQQPIISIPGYYQFWNYCSRKGYSGTAIFTKHKPLSISYDFNNCDTDFDVEGRIITLEYETFYLVNVYSPNSQMGISRINYRMDWDELFFNYVSELNYIKPVIICGDFNIAFSDLDVCNSLPNSTEFIDDQRIEFENLLNEGFIDSFRYLYPDTNDAFTWWNVGKDSKINNIGWRLDYFLVSDFFTSAIQDAGIYSQISSSDHCPISLTINIMEGDL